MAFLDNSGDIILDAVLTDTGRLRLAQGDGKFKISKFALGDDEINYALYDKNNPNGSAYYDLQVLQTPVLEAFTNNTSNLKTKLVTMPRTNVLYMPILKLNKNTKLPSDGNNQQARKSATYRRDGTQVPTFGNSDGTYTAGIDKSDNKFYVAVDPDSYKAFTQFRNSLGIVGQNVGTPTVGVIQGFTAAANTDNNVSPGGGIIRVDHGLDTDEISPSVGIDSDLIESSFIVELDYRLGRLKPPEADVPAGVNFIDDDNVATYYVLPGAASGYINPLGASPASTNSGNATSISDLEALGIPQVFDGPRGNTFQFRVHASQELRQSTYLFNQLGFSVDADSDAGKSLFGFNGGVENDALIKGKKIYYIDSTVRVVGANTGYRLDIPIRFVKLAT